MTNELVLPRPILDVPDDELGELLNREIADGVHEQRQRERRDRYLNLMLSVFVDNKHTPDVETLTKATVLLGRNEGPWLVSMLHVFGLLSQDTATTMVPSVWTSAEIPLACLTQADWRDLFNHAGFTVDGQPAERPTGPVVLYRGSPRKYRRRWSWTTDAEKARWFAERWDRADGEVWTITAPPDSILAVIDQSVDADFGRGEAEYVVDPHGLQVRQWAVPPANASGGNQR